MLTGRRPNLRLPAAVLIGLAFLVVACDALPTALPVRLPGVGTRTTLTIAGLRPQSLDPAMVQDASTWHYMLQIFGGLVSLDGDLQIVPNAASRYDLSPDGRTYTFHLRDDLRFADGRLVRAADVVYSIDRSLNPATQSPTALQYLSDIVGARDRASGKTPTIAGLRAPNDRTIVIEIDAPKRYFLSKLTYPTAFILDRQNVESGPGWFENPNGTGPFRLANWNRDEGLLLERNQNYYGDRSGPDQVAYYYGATPPMYLYEQDQIDVVAVGLNDLDRVTDPRGTLKNELHVSPILNLWYLGFNTREPPFNDVKVRQAFLLATDRVKIADVRFKGYKRLANGILPPGLPGQDPALQAPPMNLARARQLLAESTYGGPRGLPEITLAVNLGQGQVAAGFAQMYERNLGVVVAVQEIDAGYFTDLEQHKYQMFYTGWVADYPDPENFLDILFHSRSRGNYSAYANPTVDDLLERARTEPHEENRSTLYRQIERTILDEAPIIPLVHDVDYLLVKSGVKGINLTPMGILSFRSVHIESPSARANAH